MREKRSPVEHLGGGFGATCGTVVGLGAGLLTAGIARRVKARRKVEKGGAASCAVGVGWSACYGVLED